MNVAFSFYSLREIIPRHFRAFKTIDYLEEWRESLKLQNLGMRLTRQGIFYLLVGTSLKTNKCLQLTKLYIYLNPI